MSKKQPATGTPAAAKKSEPVDLTRSDLPGGNHAYWYTPDELSPRRSRELDVYDVHLIPRLRELMLAQHIIDEDGNNLAREKGLPGMPTGLTKDEARGMLEMTDANAWAYLKSWTLRGPNGGALPLPEDIDAVLDLPRDIYQALTEHAAKIIAGRVEVPDPGSVEGFEDEESPTGA